MPLNQLVENLNAGLAARDHLIAELKDRMKAKDAVVAAMGQQLMEGFAKPQATPADIQTLSIGTGDSDYFETVLKTIEENIRFIESTFLTPGDLEFSRGERLEFSQMWEAVGPKLSAAYPPDSEPSANMAKIASALNQWQRAIEDAAWKNLNDVFTQNDFKVGSFSNGAEFHDRLIAFVRTEKDARGRDNFERFNNRVWTTEVKPLWIPYLLAKGNLDDPQLADMEAAIADWGKNSAALCWSLGLTLLLVISAATLWAAKSP